MDLQELKRRALTEPDPRTQAQYAEQLVKAAETARPAMAKAGPKRYPTTKKPGDPTYSAQWSGVTGAPLCRKGCVCPKCGTALHAEAGNHYCPSCDDYVRPAGPYHEAVGKAARAAFRKADGGVTRTQQTPKDQIPQAIKDLLGSKGRMRTADISIALGYSPSKYGLDPGKNPVSTELLRMSKSGELELIGGQHGYPIFDLVRNKAARPAMTKADSFATDKRLATKAGFDYSGNKNGGNYSRTYHIGDDVFEATIEYHPDIVNAIGRYVLYFGSTEAVSTKAEKYLGMDSLLDELNTRVLDMADEYEANNPDYEAAARSTTRKAARPALRKAIQRGTDGQKADKALGTALTGISDADNALSGNPEFKLIQGNIRKAREIIAQARQDIRDYESNPGNKAARPAFRKSR